MKLFTEFFLAGRYLIPKRNPLSVIIFISIMGVSLGVCVLIVALAIMTGFTKEMQAKLLQTQPHIMITQMSGEPFYEPYKIANKVDTFGVKASVETTGQVLVQKKDQVQPMQLYGINSSAWHNFIKTYLKKGSGDLSSGDVMISYLLAKKLNLKLGDSLIIHSPGKLKKLVAITSGDRIKVLKNKKPYTPQILRVSGIFNVGDYTFDSSVILVSRSVANGIFGYPQKSGTLISIKTKNPFDMGDIIGKIRTNFPNYRVLSWKQLNARLLNMLSVQENMMFFVFIFIVLVAVSSITNTLITIVVQKRQEIGLLKALGASSQTILKVFVLQGFIIGVLGTCLGIVLGWLVVSWRMGILHLLSYIFGVEIFPKQFYFFSSLPADIVPGNVLFIAITSIVLCTLGAVIPALRASKLIPSKALRDE